MFWIKLIILYYIIYRNISNLQFSQINLNRYFKYTKIIIMIYIYVALINDKNRNIYIHICEYMYPYIYAYAYIYNIILHVKCINRNWVQGKVLHFKTYKTQITKMILSQFITQHWYRVITSLPSIYGHLYNINH